MWDRGEDVRPKYLGGDMVLLMGLSDTRAEDLHIVRGGWLLFFFPSFFFFYLN